MEAIQQLAYGPRQFAKMIGVSPFLVYQMIREGRINAVKVSEKRLIIPREELDALLGKKLGAAK